MIIRQTEKRMNMHHLQTLCYLPYINNDKVDEKFEPCNDKDTSIFTFKYSSEKIDLMTRLAKQNWSEAQEKIRDVIKEAWEKKRDARSRGA